MTPRRHLAILCIASLLANGCVPMVVHSRRKPAQRPNVFVDAATTEPIEEVLVIPVYLSRFGLATGGGDGPSAGTEAHTFVANTFVYRAGEHFAPRRGWSIGAVCFLFASGAGKTTRCKGLILVAPGYRVKYIQSWEDPESITLTTVALDEARRDLEDIATFLKEEILEGEHLYEWPGPFSPDGVEIRLSDEERAAAQAFIAEGLRQLEPRCLRLQAFPQSSRPPVHGPSRRPASGAFLLHIALTVTARRMAAQLVEGPHEM